MMMQLAELWDKYDLHMTVERFVCEEYESDASYAVKSKCRGQHIGEQLVSDCLLKAKDIGFRVFQ